MNAGYGLGAVEIGECSGYTQSPVETACRQLQCLSCLTQESNAVGVGPGDLFEDPPRCLRIGAGPICSVFGKPLTLALARSYYTGPHRCAPFSGRWENQIGGRDRRYFDLQIDTVEKRA